jgi:DNA-binding beta-propeller fold protein YncE
MIERGRALSRGLCTVGLATVFAAGPLASCGSGTDKPGDTLRPLDAASPRPEGGSTDATSAPLRDGGVEEDALSSPTDASGCEAGRSFCGGGCTDVKSDPNNCGQCTNACGKGVVCVNSQCVCPVDAGQTLCNNTCVPTATDQSNCGACGHNCQGSTCVNGLCVPTVVAQPPGTQIWDIAFDSTYIYWTQIAANGSVGAVSKKPFAGSTTTLGVNGDQNLFDPHGIFVDQLNMYWVDYNGGAVEGFPLLGGPIVVYTPSTPDGGTPAHPIDITADGLNVYWVNFDGGSVMSEPIVGGTTPLIIASGEDHPQAIAVDATNVYWVDKGTTLTGTGAVKQAPKGAPATPATLITLAQNEDQPSDIAVDGTSVYWTDRANPGAVKKTPIGGGPIVILAQNLGAPYGIAVDKNAGYVYWTNFDDNTVMRLPKAGGEAPFVLASGATQNNPAAITVDSTNVYWVNQGAGTILKVAK